MTRSSAKPRLRALVPSLGVSDLHRSIAFYRQFFGFELVDSAEDAEGAPLWAWLRSGKAELMLQQLDPEAQITLDPALGHSWVLYLQPNNLGRTRGLLAAAGVEVSPVAATTYGARECFARDPDGYSLWLSVPGTGHGPEDEHEEGDGDEFHEDDDDEPDSPDAGTVDDSDEDSFDDPDEGVIDDLEGDDADDPDEGATDAPRGGGRDGPGPDDRIH
ncbi:MAG: VOC family protein [Betaproteobacteria bacterium]|jgi:uncharacterized glyoxalase superfamily protein PhnB|nr:VOC family protein [Rhodocyclaceae bacterium]MCA3141001.1 VOC family protein [Rhodocyclaceae bacterium]